jgi:hypothetical protein
MIIDKLFNATRATVWIEQLTESNRTPRGFIFVCRPDAPSGSADRLTTLLFLAGLI